MDARLRVLTTYKLLNNTRYFRLRLCAGGVFTGVLAGVIISGFRLALTGAASLRANLQSLVLPAVILRLPLHFLRRTAYCSRFACVACQSGTTGGGQRHSAGKGRRTGRF